VPLAGPRGRQDSFCDSPRFGTDEDRAVSRPLAVLGSAAASSLSLVGSGNGGGHNLVVMAPVLDD
jgi:hypothetical protein